MSSNQNLKQGVGFPLSGHFLRPGMGAMALSLLVGCMTVGPDYQPPAPEPVTLQAAADPAFSSASPVIDWWSAFDDPTLEQLVERALADNLDLYIAMTRVRMARALFTEQRLDQFPHVAAIGSYDRRRQPEVLADGQRVTTESALLGLDAAWELDLFGRQRRATEAARAALDAEWENHADAQVIVAAEVAGTYFQLRGTQKRIALARETLENLQQTQRLTEERWVLGAGSELDVQSSRARMKAIEADIPLLEASEVQTKHRLAVLLGQRPGALEALLQPRDVPPYIRALPLGDPSNLLRMRPDVRGAERRLAVATANVGVATADLFPRISLNGFIGFLSLDGTGLLGGGNKAWSLTPTMSWAAFDLGSVRARLRATEAEADGVAAEYEKTVLLALEETENAMVRYARQQQRLLLIAEQAMAARRAEILAQARYQDGAEDFLALLDAQRNLLAADDALAVAEAATNIGVVGVYKALGGWGQPMAVTGAQAPERALAEADRGIQ